MPESDDGSGGRCWEWREVPESDGGSRGRCWEWREVPESDGGSGGRCWEWREVPESVTRSGGKCRKAKLGVEEVRESEARSGGKCRKPKLGMEEGAGKRCYERRNVPESDDQTVSGKQTAQRLRRLVHACSRTAEAESASFINRSPLWRGSNEVLIEAAPEATVRRERGAFHVT